MIFGSAPTYHPITVHIKTVSVSKLDLNALPLFTTIKLCMKQYNENRVFFMAVSLPNETTESIAHGFV